MIKRVKDVMLDLNRVPKVHREATLAEAIQALDRAQQQRPGGLLPFRVVLVVDDAGQVVGKVGHMAFLSALEPGYESPDSRATMGRAGVDPDLIETMSDLMRLYEPGFPDCCRRAAHIPVRDIMLSLDTWVDEETSLLSAVSTLVKLQTLSILVRSRGQVVGLLRLADLFDVIADIIVEEWQRDDASQRGA